MPPRLGVRGRFAVGWAVSFETGVWGSDDRGDIALNPDPVPEADPLSGSVCGIILESEPRPASESSEPKRAYL